MLSALIRLLERAGHEVVGATNGDLALDVIGREGPFDLLITDMVMPGALQGSDLAQRAREAHATLPVIFLSGYADEVARRDYEIPAGDIRLIKPVPASDLIDAVQSALADSADRL